MNAYIVLSLLTGARTEELRALRWDHLDLDADPPNDHGLAVSPPRRRDQDTPVTPHS